MKSALLAGILIATIGSPAWGQEPSPKPGDPKPADKSEAGATIAADPKAVEATDAEIRHLLDVMGSTRTARQMLSTMMATMRQAQPQVPEDVWTELLAELDAGAITELTVPIYKKHFTADDIRGLLAFYESAVGRRFIAAQPQIVEESMAVGQKWGADAAQRVFKRLQERGYLRKASGARPPAGG